MTGLDLLAIGSWTLFDHLLRLPRLPREGETLAFDMPSEQVGKIHFGDCSANTAAVAARLGLTVGLGMVVGDDFVSSGYQAHLLDLGIDLAGVEIQTGVRSGHSYNVFDSENHGFCLSHLGLAAMQQGWSPPLAQIESARAVVVSEMFSQYTLEAIEHARQRGRMTAINGMVASAGSLTDRFLAAADVVFLSSSEAVDLQAALGVPDTCSILKHGPHLIVVTRSSEGSTWYTADESIDVPAVPVDQLVDSTGAGDAFVAGALFGMSAGLDSQEAGRCGAVVASFVVESWGCQTNLPGIEDVHSRYREQFGRSFPG